MEKHKNWKISESIPTVYRYQKFKITTRTFGDSTDTYHCMISMALNK